MGEPFPPRMQRRSRPDHRLADNSCTAHPNRPGANWRSRRRNTPSSLEAGRRQPAGWHSYTESNHWECSGWRTGSAYPGCWTRRPVSETLPAVPMSQRFHTLPGSQPSISPRSQQSARGREWSRGSLPSVSEGSRQPRFNRCGEFELLSRVIRSDAQSKCTTWCDLILSRDDPRPWRRHSRSHEG